MLRLCITLPSIPVFMAFVVGVHRTVLLNERREGVGFFRLNTYLNRYFFAWLKIFFCTLPAIIVVAFFVGLISLGMFGPPTQGGTPNIGAFLFIFLLVGAIGLSLFVRLALALPDAALGQSGGLSLAWSSSRDNWLRLILVTLLVCSPIYLIGLLPMLPALKSMMLTHSQILSVPLQILNAAVRTLLAAIFTVTLSLSYDSLVRGGGPQEAQP